MDLMCTCEGCGVQPDRFVNFDLTDDGGNVLTATACFECMAVINDLPQSDPRRVAMINRIIDFQSEWPLKTEMNFLGFVSTLIDTDKPRALDLLVQWHSRHHAKT